MPFVSEDVAHSLGDMASQLIQSRFGKTLSRLGTPRTPLIPPYADATAQKFEEWSNELADQKLEKRMVWRMGEEKSNYVAFILSATRPSPVFSLLDRISC